MTANIGRSVPQLLSIADLEQIGVSILEVIQSHLNSYKSVRIEKNKHGLRHSLIVDGQSIFFEHVLVSEVVAKSARFQAQISLRGQIWRGGWPAWLIGHTPEDIEEQRISILFKAPGYREVNSLVLDEKSCPLAWRPVQGDELLTDHIQKIVTDRYKTAFMPL